MMSDTFGLKAKIPDIEKEKCGSTSSFRFMFYSFKNPLMGLFRRKKKNLFYFIFCLVESKMPLALSFLGHWTFFFDLITRNRKHFGKEKSF